MSLDCIKGCNTNLTNYCKTDFIHSIFSCNFVFKFATLRIQNSCGNLQDNVCMWVDLTFVHITEFTFLWKITESEFREYFMIPNLKKKTKKTNYSSFNILAFIFNMGVPFSKHFNVTSSLTLWPRDLDLLTLDDLRQHHSVCFLSSVLDQTTRKKKF